MSEIILDTLGSDKGPAEMIKGAVMALKELSDLEIVFSGDPEFVKKALQDEGFEDARRVSFLNGPDVILNTDHPSTAFSVKPNASMSVALEEIRKGDEDALLTCGSTGAVMAGSVLRVGRLPGVARPPLMSTIPTRKEGVLLRVLDTGANMDCKPEYLVQFAKMADVFLKSVGIENPRIGLLCVGSEEGKGNDLAKTAFPLLKESGINFIGNIEGDHVLDGNCDAVVCDGFSGNVMVKTIEGTAAFVADLFKGAMTKNIFTKFGSAFQLPALKNVKAVLGYAKKACSPLLGIKKLVVKAHGKADAAVVYESIKTVDALVKAEMVKKIAGSLAISQ